MKTLLPPPFIIFVILSPMYIFFFLFSFIPSAGFVFAESQKSERARRRAGSQVDCFLVFVFVFITIIVIISYTGFRCSRSRE